MNFNNFTTKSQEAIQQAQQIASGYNHQSIEPAHILKGMMEVDENVIPFLLKKLNVNIQQLNTGLDKIIQSFPTVQGANAYLSDDSNKMLQKAVSYLKTFGDEFVSIEHILLAMSAGKDKASTLLREL